MNDHAQEAFRYMVYSYTFPAIQRKGEQTIDVPCEVVGSKPLNDEHQPKEECSAQASGRPPHVLDAPRNGTGQGSLSGAHEET